jgi:TPR repeat protein
LDQAFIDILKQLVKEHGSAALKDAKKCKALLADYTRNEYKKQSRLLVLTVEEGIPKIIEGAQDLAACKKAQIRELEEEHGLNSVFAADIVNLLALVLRGDKTVTVSPTVVIPAQSPPVQQKVDSTTLPSNKQKAAPAAPPSAEPVKTAGITDPKAQFELGNRYANGQGVNKDETKALEWWTKAAEKGLMEAQYNVGLCNYNGYFNGSTMYEDVPTAVKWWKKAAAQGDVRAQYMLGVCYTSGYIIGKDTRLAREYFRKAAAQGSVQAKKELSKRIVLFDLLAEYIGGRPYNSPLPYITSIIISLCFAPGAWALFGRALELNNVLAAALTLLTMALGGFITYKSVEDWYYTSGGFVLITPVIALIGIIIFLIVPKPIKAAQPAPLKKTADTEAVSTIKETAEITVNANFRKGHSTNDSIIRQLKKGDLVILTGEVSGGWTQILRDGEVGWISSEFLSIWGREQSSSPQPLAQQAAAQTQTKPQQQMQPQPQTQKQNAEPQTAKQTEAPKTEKQAETQQAVPPQTAAPAEGIVDWARGNYPASIVVSANSITGHNINITGARTVVQKPLAGHPNLKWAYVYVGDKKYGVVWDRTTYTRSMHDGIELGIGSEARSAFDFYSGSDKDSIFSDIAREAPAIKVVK